MPSLRPRFADHLAVRMHASRLRCLMLHLDACRGFSRAVDFRILAFPAKPGSKSVAGKAVLEVFWSVVAPARRGNGSVAADRPAKGGHGTDGLDFDGPVEVISASVASVSSWVRFGARMLTQMQPAAS